jgi:hypothetical protein
MLCTLLVCDAVYGPHVGGFDTAQVWAVLAIGALLGVMWAVGMFDGWRDDA